VSDARKAGLIIGSLFAILAIWLLIAGPPGPDNDYLTPGRSEVSCVDKLGLVYKFRKDNGTEWWRTAMGQVTIEDGGRQYTFDKERCTIKKIE